MTGYGESTGDGRRRFAAAAERNKEPILQVLRRLLPPSGLVLEIASGTGHAVHFAAGLPGLSWQPSDPDPAMRASIEKMRAGDGPANLLPPIRLDVNVVEWGVERADAVVCINMIHIAPWAATPALMAGAGALLPAGGPLVLYGPFRRDGAHTADSNAAFDESLRRRDPSWGVRDLEAVAAEAAARGLALEEVVEMPANNLVVVFRAGDGAARR